MYELKGNTLTLKYIPKIENINRVIDMLHSVPEKLFNMADFQDNTEVISVANNLEELNSCGSAACMAGHIALNKYFQDTYNIMPKVHSGAPYKAVGEWKPPEGVVAEIFGVPELVAELLVFDCKVMGELTLQVYDGPLAEVPKQEVIERLKELRGGYLTLNKVRNKYGTYNKSVGPSTEE